MAKGKEHKQLPRKSAEAVRFIERHAEVIERRQKGSHIILDVRGPKGVGRVNVPVHGSKEMTRGVWGQIQRELVRIGVLSVIILVVVMALYLLIF